MSATIDHIGLIDCGDCDRVLIGIGDLIEHYHRKHHCEWNRVLNGVKVSTWAQVIAIGKEVEAAYYDSEGYGADLVEHG